MTNHLVKLDLKAISFRKKSIKIDHSIQKIMDKPGPRDN
jgi:hypothetical protein